MDGMGSIDLDKYIKSAHTYVFPCPNKYPRNPKSTSFLPELSFVTPFSSGKILHHSPKFQLSQSLIQVQTDNMRTSIFSVLLFTQVILGSPLQAIRDIDWEKELLGRSSSDNNLEPRQARSEKSLDAIFKSIGKLYFGTCADSGLLNNAQNAAILKADFGQLTPENRFVPLLASTSTLIDSFSFGFGENGRVDL